MASNHLPDDLLESVTYECVSIEDLALRRSDERFDAVVMSEVIEHIEDQENFIRTATQVLQVNRFHLIETYHFYNSKLFLRIFLLSSLVVPSF